MHVVCKVNIFGICLTYSIWKKTHPTKSTAECKVDSWWSNNGWVTTYRRFSEFQGGAGGWTGRCFWTGVVCYLFDCAFWVLELWEFVPFILPLILPWCSPQQALHYLVLISEVEETEIFKICLEYWNSLASDLYRENPFPTSASPLLMGTPQAGQLPARRQLYLTVLSKVCNNNNNVLPESGSTKQKSFKSNKFSNLSLLWVINVKFPLQPHQKYCITWYGELGFS